jgi:tetratricopeptide (TPR) repeat protein
LEGLELAKSRKDWLGEVDLLQRISFLISSMGADYRAALRISEDAAALCSRCGDLNKLGQILVDQGHFLFYLEQYDDSRKVFEIALRFLEETEHRNRIAALHTLGHLFQVGGCPGDALSICKQLEQSIRSRFERGKLRWLEGCALADLKRWESSFKGFEEAWSSLFSISPIDAALSACDHVDALLKSGSVAEARARAQTLQKVLEPLKDNLLASAAIRDLLRCEQEGEQLTVAFLSKIKKRIEISRRADARRQG